MSDTFEPRNELEQKLQAAQVGKIPGDVFMQELMELQVFMPVEDKLGIGGFQSSNKAKPLTVTAEDGAEVLVLFTSPERAKPFVKDFPGYEGGLLAEFKWVLERAGAHGISLNPGWEVGIDMEPEMVQQLARTRAGES
jgi:hypothetical protein